MKKILLLSSGLALLFTGCKGEDTPDTPVKRTVNVSFAKAAETAEADTNVQLVFSAPTTAAGTIELNIEENNVSYGTDYVLSPEKSGATLKLSYEKGVKSVAFTFKKKTDVSGNAEKSVTFNIASISDQSVKAAGITKTVISFQKIASQGGSKELSVGGSTEPNQVFFDFSGEAETSVRRDTWDLGFYNGPEYRVKINGSIKMAIKKLDISDITQVVQPDPSVAVSTANNSSMYVDGPTGLLSETRIDEISENENENKVYLVNLGGTVPTTPAEPGSTNVYGNDRGWKKIKINRAANGYKLLYADLSSTTYSEATITKDDTYNFSFFNLLEGKQVNVEPAKNAWDIQYTVFTNVLQGNIAYLFSDFIVINRLAGVKAYLASDTTNKTYEEFTAADVDQSKFVSNDQRVIGESWRNVFQKILYTDVFYVLEDTEGNRYKLKMTQYIKPSNNERGYPIIEYSKL